MEERLLTSVIFDDLIFDNAKNRLDDSEINGGKGSGYWGHGGREGLVGGSSASGAKASLKEIYDKYPGLKTTLDKMEKINAAYSETEREKLDKIYEAARKVTWGLEKERDKIEAALKEKGADYDAIHKDKEYLSIDAKVDAASKIDSDAFGKWRDYKMDPEATKTILKEKLYQSIYGENWKDKYTVACQTLRDWAENKYAKAKASMVGDNYGSLEVEHALTQAYFLRKNQSEVEIMWGAYGKTAQNIIDGKNTMKKDIISVTSNKEIAESYGAMDRMTSGTKRIVLDTRSDNFPSEGVVVKATIPASQVIVSHHTVANTSPFTYRTFEMQKISPGYFLKDQDEYIVDIPSKADVSNFYTVPTSPGMQDMHDAIMEGKTWSEVI